MTAHKHMIAKTAALVAGFALVASSFVAFTPSARAATIDELQAQIQVLLAQIASLNGGASAGSYTYTRDLTLGASGADVTALQSWLISKGYSIPAGATGYFGAQTQSALAAYQAANGIAPAAGYFGPVTRAKVNAQGTVTIPDTGGSTSGLGKGEASIERLRASSGEEDEVAEGSAAEVAEFEFRVKDGDIRVERLDLTFEPASGNDEDEPWKTFDTITILDAKGKTLVSKDVSDEDDWLEDDEPYVFRFTGLNYVVKKGDTGTLVVEAEVQNSVDGTNDGESWTIYIDSNDLRAIDGEGIDQYAGNSNQSVTFDVVAEGEGEELKVRSSSDNPSSTILKVENNKRSSWYTIFAFDIEAEDADIEIETATTTIQVSSNDFVSGVVNDLELVIDGKTIDDWSWVSGANSDTAVIAFDVDGDVTIDEGDRVTAELRARFNATSTSSTIKASVASGAIEGEGADDVFSTGAASGNTHTLSLSTARISNVSWTKSVTGDSTDGTLDFFFTVTAVDEDFDLLAAEIIDSNTMFFGATTTPVTLSQDGSLSRVSGDSVTAIGTTGFTISEGDTTRFRVRYVLADAGTYEVTIESIAGIEIDDEDQLSPTVILAS